MYRFVATRPAPARPLRRFAAANAAVILALALPAAANAARVSGTLMGYETSAPLPSRDLHFENSVTHDVYLTPTHADGSFAGDLPAGLYDLRAERGAILVHGVLVRETDVQLGHVSEVAPYSPARLFQFQDVANSLVTSPAPSTAFIMTVDTTVIPPSAAAVPKPEVNWNKLPPGSEATGPTGADLPPAGASRPTP